MKNRPCPKCREVGRDSKGDHLWLMSDGTTWACFKDCHPPYFEREGETDGDYKEVRRDDSVRLTVKDITKLPIRGNVERKISEDTMKEFRVRTEYGETDGQPCAVYYPETYRGKIGSYKRRGLPKSFSVTKDNSKAKGQPDFFGEFRCPRAGKRILICAGEEDTLAAYEILNKKYPDWDHAIVGLPRGEETSVNVVAEKKDFLNGFDEILLCTDMDDAGRSALTKLIPVIGHNCKAIHFSENDISDMHTKGKHKEFLSAYFSAKEYRPSSIVVVDDILEEAIKPRPWGLSYPFPKLTQLTYGMKEQGEVIGLGAAPGAGKTTLFQQFQQNLIFNHKEEIAVFPIEEGPTEALNKLIGSILNLPIHLPDCNYDTEDARGVGEQLRGLVNFYGGDSENWAEVEDGIRYFQSKGIRFFFIDPLSALVEHLSASEGNTELGKIMRSMRKFRKDHALTFFHANHLNNPQSGKDHGEGGAVRGSQFSGSRAQWKYSTLLMGLEGNQLAEDESEKFKRRLGVIKDRLGGKTGYVDLRYDPTTGNLEEDEFKEDVL